MNNIYTMSKVQNLCKAEKKFKKKEKTFLSIAAFKIKKRDSECCLFGFAILNLQF